ncbi:uncharacterized protein [Triticum aestivum]|uniref:uncharacterized protein isoform X1 n=1 Tax=Triticum aestivum TaxID=4565 RepID=UPI00098A3FA2|nr:uncharacterized protein LOC123163922 isoform X1 [Triticum aestivum]XP_044437262.1 uncharacterized protein LOC123163922 isoform X1 [Triticum aestivum]XP_044437263.1 uncharacterized protein LOC123163922 isoform X1 [Triticum aestivum]
MRWRGRQAAPPVRFDQRMAVFAETKLQRDGIELSTGFRVIKDRRTNLSYSQHASLVYMPVPTKKISYAPGGAGGVRGSQLQWRRMRSTGRASWRYHNISKCYNKEKKSLVLNNMRKLLLEVVDSRAVLKILLRIFSVLL